MRTRIILGALHFLRAKLVLALCLAFSGIGFSGQIAQQNSELFEKAVESMRRGDLDSASEGFAAAVKASPNFAEGHFNLGLVREEQGRFGEAITSLQKALSLKPGMHGANLFLGIAFYRVYRFESAISAVKKETSAYPKDAPAWMWQGVIALAMDHPEEAAIALDKAASLAPDNVDILYHRGQAHLLVSKNSYEKMFKVDPKSWRVHQVIAQANSEADRPLDAIAEYQEAIKLAPTQPGLHEELGSEYRGAGKPLEAEAEFKRELEINPSNAIARYKLGVLAIDRGDGAHAKELIKAALKQKTTFKHADYNLGRAEMLIGNDENALGHLQKATASETDPEVLQQAWFQLGIVYRRLHHMPEAQQAIATFQRLKNEQAEKAQAHLNKIKARQDAEVAQPTDTESNPQ